MVGIAARSGIALGIHLERKGNGVDLSSGEARKQLWWSITRLEHLLSVMTGRVSCVGPVSTSLPPSLLFLDSEYNRSDSLKRDDETSSRLQNLHWTMQIGPKSIGFQRTLLQSLTPSMSLYHFYMIDLSHIAHAISSGVYATDSHRYDWGRIESRIALYNRRIDDWVSRLIAAFRFQDSHGNPLHVLESPFQVSLALSYYSARIVLNRPCLNCPTFKQKTGTRLARSRFSNLSALACLRASLAVTSLLPDQPSLDWSYGLLQWWEFLHVLTQAVIILLLDLSIGPVPTKSKEDPVVSESVEIVLNATKKGILWLQCLGKTSEAARRSFGFSIRCIRHLSTARDLDLSGIPSPTSQEHPHRSTETSHNKRSTHGILPLSDSDTQDLNDAPYPEATNRKAFIQDLSTRHASTDTEQEGSSVYDGDIDMSDLTSQLENSPFEDLLLSIISP